MIDKTQCPAHTRTPWGESDHRYSHRLRYGFMCVLSAIVVAVIVVGVVFLVERSRGHWKQIDLDNVSFVMAQREESLEMPKYPYHPPFHACGDQLHDCQQFYRPHFCCPPRMTCHKSIFSPSGIYCCEDPKLCIVSDDHLPTCPGNTTECGRELGGGCCPHGTTCSPDGCLEFVEDDANLKKPSAASQDRTKELLNLLNGAPVLEAKMATEEFSPTTPPQVTYTGIKFGETAYVSIAWHLVPLIGRGTIGVILSVALSIVASSP